MEDGRGGGKDHPRAHGQGVQGKPFPSKGARSSIPGVEGA